MGKSTNRNPFILSGYQGPEYFCDRETETNRLVSNVLNGVNSTVISIRRMGKTGLIMHAIHQLENMHKVPGIYLDIYAEQDLNGFTNSLATACLRKFPEKTAMGKLIWKMIKSMRPVITYDTYTGQPQVTIDFRMPEETQKSIQDILQLMDNHGETMLIALDEFQQITHFREKNIEAILRTAIQPLKNLRFIFSGSQQHMLAEMFQSSKRPFFSATQSLHLGPIETDAYSSFIRKHFEDRQTNINQESIEYILSFTRQHTYYTQLVCNRLYAVGLKEITVQVVKENVFHLMREQAPVYLQLRSLLSANQWSLLIAIAKEGKLFHPTSGEFLKRHGLGSGSAVQRALNALIEKEMVYVLQDDAGPCYSVYDTLMSRWMETL